MHSLVAPSPPQSQRLRLPLVLAALALLVLVAGASLVAQVSGERGIAPVASSTDIEVRGIEVNTTGETPEEARMNGWREAQRIAWERIEGPEISDSRLESLVAAIVIEEERLGPRRYVATLGVIFDRQRAGGLLGTGGTRSRSAPMLTLPVMVAGGTSTMFEMRNPWQRAWAEYQFGSSTVDYVRPTGSGGESLLLTYGQTGRRSRAWWNVVLDQFSAADVLIPVAKLQYQWPGGPVEGEFTARYGPDNRFLAEFAMRAESIEELPDMLTRAVARFDEIYQRALAAGTLQPDPTLTLDNVELSPEIRALIDASRAAEEAEQATGRADPVIIEIDPLDPSAMPEPVAPPQPVVLNAISIQVATPDARSFDAALTGLRQVSGVRGVAVNSTAIGGVSVLRADFAGSISELAAVLRAAGWQVTEGNNALAISR